MAEVAADGATRSAGSYRPGYELVAERILQLIAESGLRPGDRMPTEKDLAERLDASRSVVREAVKILSAIGRVRAHKGRGLYVADDVGMLGSSRWGGFFLPTDLDHVYMLFEFRRIQETAASRLAAAHATPAQLRAIETAVETCRQGYVTGQAALFDRGDDDFHPPRDPRREAGRGRGGRRGAPGQHARGPPPRDPAPPLRLKAGKR